MAKSKTASYVLTLQLKTEKFQEDILNNRFEKCRKIYNSCLGEALKRYNHMIESKEYQKNCKNKDKNRNSIFNDVNKKYNLTEYDIIKFVTPLYNYFKIDGSTGQKLASRAFKTIQKLMFHTANKVNFIKEKELCSVEGATNRQGITYRNGIIKWNGLKIPIIIKQNDIYAQAAIQDNIKYCRIVRKLIRGKYKYYVQLILEGIPPIKTNKQTGEIKNPLGNDNVGIDIGTRTIAYSSNKEVKLLELCPEVENIEHKKLILQRKLDRQRRANSPNNYNEDGTIKRGIKLVWNKSNKYIKTQNELREIQRKQACIRKQSHEKLANHILTLGDRVLVETMQFQGLQKRAKKTTINKNGKINKKKRFGKSLANKAPAMLIEIINRKLKYNGLEILKINTQKVKASQYNHFRDDYNKKELSDRWNESIEIQRDIYSAFLIMNVNDDLETINKQLCNDTYDNFKILHDEEVNRLKQLKANGYKLISSMGI